MLDIFILLTVTYPAQKTIQDILGADYGILHCKHSNTTNQSNDTLATVYTGWRFGIFFNRKITFILG
jgi:hypothetical protein